VLIRHDIINIYVGSGSITTLFLKINSSWNPPPPVETIYALNRGAEWEPEFKWTPKILNNNLLLLNSQFLVLVQPLHRQKIDWKFPSSLSVCFNCKHKCNSRLSATFFTSSCFFSFCNMISAKSYSILPSSSCSSLATSQEVLRLQPVAVPILFEFCIWLLLF